MSTKNIDFPSRAKEKEPHININSLAAISQGHPKVA